MEFEPLLTDLAHTRSCPALTPGNDESCTCGLKWRVRLRTEMEMHNAWRKRAEELERTLAEMPPAEEPKMTIDERLRLPCGICGRSRREHVGKVFGCPQGYGTSWNPEGKRDERVWPIHEKEAEMPPAAPPSDLLQRLEVYAVHWDKGHRAVFWDDIEREVRK
jgi:hypothetical protein